MPRIRSIKPEFWSSPDTARLSLEARLLFIGLWNFADDDGRFLASINAVNGAVFPNDDMPPKKVRAWLDELVAIGSVHLYTADGVQYGAIPSWHKHQKINRYNGSRLPAPDIECAPRKRGGSDD